MARGPCRRGSRAPPRGRLAPDPTSPSPLAFSRGCGRGRGPDVTSIRTSTRAQIRALPPPPRPLRRARLGKRLLNAECTITFLDSGGGRRIFRTL
ncbi:hypothetical protein NDU88_000604 [Pleurodeles waltl]|uniref:Uncharacterized protein n=1 Tax=Pleurodeles waltl TaxID=8319 RepID=A0AAV7LW03_PLEWA|nr:hypothetical protein NDU88_000604 [Pleurodeles waltl]